MGNPRIHGDQGKPPPPRTQGPTNKDASVQQTRSLGGRLLSAIHSFAQFLWPFSTSPTQTNKAKMAKQPEVEKQRTKIAKMINNGMGSSADKTSRSVVQATLATMPPEELNNLEARLTDSRSSSIAKTSLKERYDKTPDAPQKLSSTIQRLATPPQKIELLSPSGLPQPDTITDEIATQKFTTRNTNAPSIWDPKNDSLLTQSKFSAREITTRRGRQLELKIEITQRAKGKKATAFETTLYPIKKGQTAESTLKQIPSAEIQKQHTSAMDNFFKPKTQPKPNLTPSNFKPTPPERESLTIDLESEKKSAAVLKKEITEDFVREFGTTTKRQAEIRKYIPSLLKGRSQGELANIANQTRESRVLQLLKWQTDDMPYKEAREAHKTFFDRAGKDKSRYLL